jgi:hypothetical protein
LRTADRHLAALNRLPPAPGQRAAEADTARDTVREFHLKVDHAASHGAPGSFRELTAATVWLHVLATALAAATLAFHLHHAAMPWGKLLCLLGALGVAMLIRHHRHQQDWVRCRLAAEITRSALATWGQPRGGGVLDDFDWAGLEPLRRSLEVLQRRSLRSHPVAFAEFSRHYRAERIEGQLAYFARQESRAVPQLARLRLGFTLSSVGAIVFTAIYAAHSALAEPIAPHWMETWVFGFGPIRAARAGRRLHLARVDQRSAPPRGPLPGNARPARGGAQGGFVRANLGFARPGHHQDGTRAAAGSVRVALDHELLGYALSRGTLWPSRFRHELEHRSGRSRGRVSPPSPRPHVNSPDSSGPAIFLSYSRDNLPAARRLAEVLRGVGLEVWFDENELTGGDAWDQRFARRLPAAPCSFRSFPPEPRPVSKAISVSSGDWPSNAHT